MALINWSDALSVGIKEIDDQHKKLIDMVNDLHAAMGTGKGKDALGAILNGLIEYTKGHFATEERYMQKYQYAEYAAHKAEHDKLTAQVIDLREKFKSGKAMLTVEVMNFLRDWLSKHIQQTDKRYGPFLNQKGIS